MFATRLIGQLKVPKSVRHFGNTVIRCKQNPQLKEIKEKVLGVRMHTVTNFDKRILVWTKRYPSIAEVPNKVTLECMLSAHSKARIRTCNIMIVGTILYCAWIIFDGKRKRAMLIEKTINERKQKAEARKALSEI